MIDLPTGGKFDLRAMREVRPSRHGATATGPKIAALLYARCGSCRHGVVYTTGRQGPPPCPHCGNPLP